MAKAKGGALISDNRKARHYYELSEFTEAGIVLTGPEVKSLRAGKISFLDSYVDFKNGEAWLIGMNIAPYGNAGYVPQVPDRPRKLLLHRQELSALAAKVEQKGLTVVPVKLYFHNGRVKLE
ncbi:MAG: SsrA-binding protein SmpB, partial [Desulfovibrionaceae bacterium]|nr:SsrA-binding protein SmpB [Desulfovibrionaceae bacterium]